MAVAPSLDDPELERVRVDRWLWAARAFKTRSAAAAACNAGHVKIAGVSVKPAKTIGRGTVVEAFAPGGLRIWEVVGLSKTRGPAPNAKTLYVDHSPPPPPKEEGVQRERGAGRPSKRDRRALKKLRGY